jgi:hypothetical protein
MVSSKGKPTDPELREELKEGTTSSLHFVLERPGDLWSSRAEIKQEPNKSGGGEGQWAAWKVGLLRFLLFRSVTANRSPELQANKLAKEYEAKGGEYENEAGSTNQPEKGEPQKKSEKQKKEETEEWG